MKKITTRFQRTFKQLFLFLLIVSVHSCSREAKRHEIIKPVAISSGDIKTVRDIPESHKVFLARFLPEIQTANNNILFLRNRVLDYRDSLDKKDHLNENYIKGLNRLLIKYRLAPVPMIPKPTNEQLLESISKLLKRLDIIPVKLVMAQAIIESGWGNSKFAQDGNNYFGVHCYTEGCGIKPDGNDSADFFVKTYPTEMAGIEDYLWILNTGYAYRGLRQTRLELRNEDQPIDPIELAKGLSRYSEKGEEYVEMVSNIIQNYIPADTRALLEGKKP